MRQGCNLSPLLFSLFISDIDSHLSSNRADSITLTNLKVQLLLFADDLVLLADSIQGLQDSLDKLSEYCQTWKLKINIDNTKGVVFYKNRSYCHAPFLFNNVEMEFGTTYKYLGIVLASNGSFKPAITTLANKVTKALFSLFRVTAKLSFPDPSLTCFLFDILVKPILEYGNEVWGCFPADELESVHRKFCKFVLGS